MKNPFFYTLIFVFGMILLTGCKGENTSSQLDEAEKEVIETIDSLSADLDKTIETLDTKSKELEEDIDELLKDLD